MSTSLLVAKEELSRSASDSLNNNEVAKSSNNLLTAEVGGCQVFYPVHFYDYSRVVAFGELKYYAMIVEFANLNIMLGLYLNKPSEHSLII